MSNAFANTLYDRLGTQAEAQKLGLLEGEFEMIVNKLGRNPTFTELVMFSGMWSEHCSYKNSILLLKTLYSESDRLLADLGEENAGALRLNDSLAVVFKIESHNHPSALEPYQGAATGVGGIMRDIFTMGARPIVSLNSLRFGFPQKGKNQWLLSEVVKGIGDYGNSLGIPCAGGEVWFHNSFSQNPLVNAMTVGIAPIEKLASAKASGIGNLVIYFGAKTGRDGIFGASFASKDLSQESSAERSAVQVGDPFMEKLLMEATLECIHKNLVVAIQDMGAAGLLSSSSEMASLGEVGLDLYLEKVPAREDAMLPFEFMLSESQERMLAVIEPSKLDEVKSVFQKWDLHAEVIGQLADHGALRVYMNNNLYASIPAKLLTKEAPRYKRESKEPAPIPFEGGQISFMQKALNKGAEETSLFLQKVFAHPNFASRMPIYNQYDTDIGLGRVIGPGQNAGVYRIQDLEMGLALTTDGNSFYVSLDPYLGTMHTVCESIRNISATGAKPLGITNCLNFANPYKPENYHFFENSIKGLSDSARFFEIPVTGGNVSFYNESGGKSVLPTPTIGMVGIVDDTQKCAPARLKLQQEILLIGFFEPRLECSGYAFANLGFFGGALPKLDLNEEKKSMEFLQKLFAQEVVLGASDLSFGGLHHTLMKMIFAGREECPELGLRLQQRPSGDPDLVYWGETAHCYLVSISTSSLEFVQKSGSESGVNTVHLGTTNDSGHLQYPPEDNNVSLPLAPIQKAWQSGLKKYF